MDRWWLLLFFLGASNFIGVTVISEPFGMGSAMSWSALPPPYSMQWYLNLRQHKLPLVLSSPLHPFGYASQVRPIFKHPLHIFENRLFPTVVKVDPFSPAQNRLFPSHPVQDLMTFVGTPRLFPALFGRELKAPLPEKTEVVDNDTIAIAAEQIDNSTFAAIDLDDESREGNDTIVPEVDSKIHTSGFGSVLLSRLRRSATREDPDPSARSMSSSVVIFPSMESNSEKTQQNSDELHFSPAAPSATEKVDSTKSSSSEHLDASGKLFMDGPPLFGGFYGPPHPFYPRPVLGSPDHPMSSLYSSASSSPSTSFLSSSIPGSGSGAGSQQHQQQQHHHLQSSNHHPQMLPPHHPSFLYPAMSAMYPAMLPHYPMAIGHHGYYPFPSPYQAVSVESLLVPLIGLVGLSLLVPDIIKTKREGRPSDIGGIDVFKRGSVNASATDEDCMRRLACEAGVIFSEDDDVEAIQRALEKAITAKRLVPAHHVGDHFEAENKTVCSHHVCASWMLDVNQLSSMSSIT